MRVILLFYFFFIGYIFQAQENFSLVLKSKINYNDSIQIAKGYDGYNFYYYNNSIIKRNLESTYRYKNIDLGEIKKIDQFNPLQTKLLYTDQNSVVILDNKLSEIKKNKF